jgi:GT2 family glycosyltransferase/lipopolysaccharide/colanic/teichoic acid biosynthesis glycosyltransferase
VNVHPVEVSVVIVSYNSADVIGPCLESLRSHDCAASTEVIVVDNASTDGTPDLVRREHPWVTLVAGSENLGYSRGVNVGIRRASGRYFFILNPDTVVRGDSIRRLVDFMERTPDAGIVGPKLVYLDGNVQPSCRRFYSLRVLLLRRTILGKIWRGSSAEREHLMLDFDHDETRPVDWVLGAAMFVRREAVESVGLMDERFFLYFEDVDWCYRMYQNRLKVYFYPDAVIVHTYKRESAQSVVNRSFVAHFVSLLRYYEKWNFLVYLVKRYREVVKVALFLALDVVAFNLAFLSAYYMRAALDQVFPNPIFPIAAYRRFVYFENLLFVFTYFALGLYRVRRETRSLDELFEIAKAIALASVLLMSSTYLGQIRTYSRMVVAFVVPFAVLYDWGLRAAARRLHRRLLSLKVDLKRVCIVGPKDRARALEPRLLEDDRLGLDVVGIVDTAAQSEGILTGTLGPPEEIERIVGRHRIQEVIVMPGALDDVGLARLVDVGRRKVVDVTVLADYAAVAFSKAVVGELQGRPVVTYRRDTRYAFDRLVKRTADALAGLLFLVVSALPCMVYSVYALSRGRRPFTHSDRLGLEGEPFALPVAGSDSANGPSDFVNPPLFWLIVIGRMSLVGPHPLRFTEGARLEPGARFRFDVRPGVTGYWRMDSRERVGLDELLAQDAHYVRNWSLGQDVKILLATAARMVGGRRRRPPVVASEEGTT